MNKQQLANKIWESANKIVVVKKSRHEKYLF